MASYQYIFTMKDLRKVWPGGKEVLKGIHLQFFPGAKIGVLGNNGSGKSTLLRIIAGLVAPSSGVAECRGSEIQGPPSGVAMVFQSFALFPWLTVLQNVELGLEA
ncbi:MAG: ATP-binding cassette domain-containing protein, partial [Nannocystaceae bacterium]|nr:ATP-binding cassette domain-containing protein [Nannocystaceae bacterium]